MGTKERIRKAFCNICSGRWAENPDGSGCGGHFEGISKDDICLVLTDPAWLARSARRFVRIEERERELRLSSAQHILAIKPIKDKKIGTMLKMIADGEII